MVRFDIPTSEASQMAGEMGQLWLSAGITKDIGNFEIRPSVIVVTMLNSTIQAQHFLRRAVFRFKPLLTELFSS